ncbi:hypothetical protein LTR64_008501 [Lithohypha guttulata]|uniref:uncharacterized protein n=1 Tax=Lithohypha guttulata TaxID=1690604 RepID=UPI002DDF7EB7|nr:hypothetical protein LTR51_001734 [Lithohypha guttulata]
MHDVDRTLVDKVESQRAELESNVAKLRKALNHWQTLELDYEGLKEEFQELPEQTTKREYLDAAHDFAPHIVDDKELEDLIEPSKGKLRQPKQVVDLLSKRTEWVSRNITSLKAQIADFEKKHESGHDEHEQETTLPVAEITEELDDQGNVISSTIQPQSESASKVLGILEKEKVLSQEARSEPQATSIGKQQVKDENIETAQDVSESLDSTEESAEATLTDGTTVLPSSYDEVMNPDDTEEEAQIRKEMLQYDALAEVGNIVAELDLAEGSDSFRDDGEFSEDPSDAEDDHDDDDSWDDDDDDLEEDEEDEYGRVRAPRYTQKQRQQMEELQRRLGFQMENVGPTPDLPKEVQEQIEVLKPLEAQQYLESLPPSIRNQLTQSQDRKIPPKEAARKAAIARYEASQDGVEKKSKTANTREKPKKSVAFAPELDIAEEAKAQQPKTATTREVVIERSGLASNGPAKRPPQPTAGKASRFKTDRASHAQASILPPPMEPKPKQDSDLGPPGKTLSENLVERSIAVDAAQAPDPDDFDEELQKRQIALEHHQLRNRKIHEQGGYVKSGEDENWDEAHAVPEVLDRITGQPRKISRFKAARLRS